MISVQKTRQNETRPSIELINVEGLTSPWSFIGVNLKVDHCNLSRSEVKILCDEENCITEFHTSTFCFVSATKNAHLKFSDCIFTCADIYKTAIIIEDSNVIIEDSTFEGQPEKALGAILQISKCSLHIYRSLFQNFRMKSGVLLLSNINQVVLQKCVFQNNSAAVERMSIISMKESFSIKISGCRFTKNMAPRGGATVGLESSDSGCIRQSFSK